MLRGFDAGGSSVGARSGKVGSDCQTPVRSRARFRPGRSEKNLRLTTANSGDADELDPAALGWPGVGREERRAVTKPIQYLETSWTIIEGAAVGSGEAP